MQKRGRRLIYRELTSPTLKHICSRTARCTPEDIEIVCSSKSMGKRKKGLLAAWRQFWPDRKLPFAPADAYSPFFKNRSRPSRRALPALFIRTAPAPHLVFPASDPDAFLCSFHLISKSHKIFKAAHICHPILQAELLFISESQFYSFRPGQGGD